MLVSGGVEKSQRRGSLSTPITATWPGTFNFAMRQARKLVIGYFKGMRGAAALRNEAGKLSTLDDLYQLKEKVIRG